MMRLLKTILFKECRLAFRERQTFFTPLLFFIMVISLFPLAISPDPASLHKIAPGVIWVAALLSILLSLDKLFKTDFEDGALEQMLLSTSVLIYGLSLIALIKVLSYWVLVSLPLLILTPLICMMYDLTLFSAFPILMGLLLGTPVLCLVGAIGSALTVGLRNSGTLLTLLVLPFYVPVLIFGANMAENAASGLAYSGELAFLGALLLISLVLCPFAIAGALRISVNY